MPLLGPSKPRLPVGISDFRELRQGGYTYVDKTLFIAHVIDAAGKSLLFPRPRRFGKTLGMSTLRYFFESGGEDHSALFEGTAIWEADGGRYREEHFGKHPVVYLTFKDVKERSWEGTWKKMRALLTQEIERLVQLHDLRPHIERNGPDTTWFEAAYAPDACPEDLANMFGYLARWLQEVTGQMAVILTDEYDAPLHAAWANDYWEEAVTFFRSFLSAGYKDTPVVFRAVLTGILKVAKENIFSGLNNVRTFTVVSQSFQDDFGFTEGEVEDLLDVCKLRARREEVRRWYNGYRFGTSSAVTMYNPWSVSSYLVESEDGPRSFWNETSDNALVKHVMVKHVVETSGQIELLLRGETVDVHVEESVVLREIFTSANMMWSLLLYTGYLTTERVSPTRRGFDARLRVPNEEVLGVFESVYERILPAGSGGSVAGALTRALFGGDEESLEGYLRDILKNAMSYFDFGGDKPIEAVYQAFIIGLLVHLSQTHDVRSNRESGYGRADVLITPKNGGSGAVLELKVINADKGETPEQAVESALKQVVERKYASEVLEAGAERAWEYGIAFDGKRCWVKKASS